MTPDRPDHGELQTLLSAMFDGQMTAAERTRLADLLSDNPEAQQTYLDFCWTHALLRRELSACGEAGSLAWDDEQSRVEGRFPQTVGDPPIAPIILDSSPTLHSPLITLHSPVGSFLFSYLAGALLLGIGLLIGWTWKISHDYQPSLVHSFGPQSPESGSAESPSVGHISGMVDCRWVDPSTEAAEHDVVPLGRRYDLRSGFLEITYDSGARVILQGPCRYDVESLRGGFLAIGRLTARVEKKGSGAKGERTANPALSQDEMGPTASLAPRPSSGNRTEAGREKGEGGRERGEGRVEGGQWAANPKSQIPNQQILFSVRTPTAVVTDLGTEFGVEVDRSGATQSHVFRGRIEMCSSRSRLPGGTLAGAARPTVERADRLPGTTSRPAGGTYLADAPIILTAGESARAEPNGDRTVRVIRQPGQPQLFVRQIPRRVPIKLFNTGVGLEVGSADPHWQVVAVSDFYPGFKPQPATVLAIAPDAEYLRNEPWRSQWINLRADGFYHGVVYTFRTTFELADVALGTATLRGRLIADDHVRAIRINGKSVPPPEHGDGDRRDCFKPFSVKEGFIEGVNVLEFDLYSKWRGKRTELGAPIGLTMLRIELSGYYVRQKGDQNMSSP